MLARRAHMSAGVAALVLGLAMALPAPASAHHFGETYKRQFKTAVVQGSFRNRACAVQANVRSARKKIVTFGIYWRPGKSLHLVATHPDYASVSGAQKIQFRFPDGQGIAFPMLRTGKKLQIDLGFGSKAQTFNKMVRANKSVTIDLLGVKDRMVVDLREQAKIIAAFKFCREEFLH